MSPQGKRIQVRFPDRLKEEIERMAEETGRTEGRIVVELVERALSVDVREMQKQVIGMHETIQSLIDRINKLESTK